MTEHDWLAIPEDKLPTALAEALTPGPWKHSNIADSRHYGLDCKKHAHGKTAIEAGHFCDSCVLICRKCNQKLTWYEHQQATCPVPDPITIDWNTAMEWFRKTEECEQYLWEIWKLTDVTELSWGMWMSSMAQPKHYLIAAAMAAERK